jgi:chromosome segregation ATPase
MELEQIIQKVDWLDDERRKTHTLVSGFESRLAALEGNIPPLIQQLKALSSDINRLNTIITRMDRYDDAILQMRVEIKQSIEELERQFKKREEDTEKIRRVEMRSLDASLVELRKEISPIPELKRAFQSRVDEDARLSKSIDEVRVRLETIKRSEEEYIRSFRLVEDGRRQDAKRLTDLQGETTALRKQMDEQRGKSELFTTSMRKIETRLNELSLLEVERREVQDKFLENQTLLQVERDRIWKDWESRFDAIEAETADIASNLETLDTTHRAVKRSQVALDELAQKVDRRVNEMTEIQRLSEERFRQEWVTFKADDQKRWTNYTLTQEEQRGESLRQNERLGERLSRVEDTMEEIQDLLAQTNELSEKRLQSLLATVHEWVSTYERSLGRAR